ncbi:MAG: hypothetical protein ACO2OV_01240 [Thermoproteota archaeon]|jgi:hypothetical protein
MLFIPFNIFTLVFWIISIEIQTDLFYRIIYEMSLLILGILSVPLIGLCINWWAYVVYIENITLYYPYNVLPKLLSERQFNFLTTPITLFFILGIIVFFSSYFFNPLLGILIFIIIMGISALLLIGITIRYRRMLSLNRRGLIKVWIQFISIMPLVVLASFITIELYIQNYLFFEYFIFSLTILGFLTWPFIGLWFAWNYHIRYKEGKIIPKGKIWKSSYMEYHPHSELLKLLGRRQFRLLTILIFLLLIIPLITALFLLLLFQPFLGSPMLIIAWLTLIITLGAEALLTIGIIMKYKRTIPLSRNEYIRLWLQFILILITVIFTSLIVNDIFGK